MTDFSASDAALEGFALLRRRWRVVLGWAGFNLVALIMVVVLTVIFSLITAALTGAGAGAGASATAPTAAVAALVGGLGSLVLQTVLVAGVFRLMIRPEEPAFLHLRLGRDELRLIGVFVVRLLALALLTVLAAALGQAAGGGRAAVLIELAVAALAAWLLLRTALTGPASFADGGLAFARSWRLTRGRAGALLGMVCLTVCLMLLIGAVLLLALALIAVRVGGLSGVASMFGGAEALETHPGLFLLGFAVNVVLTPALWVLWIAPFVAAWRALSGGGERA
jgi:hypothetical protein